MIIVTGGAGFIGSNLVRALNLAGRNDVIVVDDMSDSSKFRNIVDCNIHDYVDKSEFILLLENGTELGDIDVIFHQGACSDTTEADGKFMLDNNYRYSRRLLNHCLHRHIPFIYASSAAVYGNEQGFMEKPSSEKPVNVYAYSKLLFDNYVRRQLIDTKSQIVGLRYFNAYGPGESHKGKMASVAYHFNRQVVADSVIRLFEGYDGYASGEQQRDFIHIDDVIAINLWFLQNGRSSGIFNVGTGIARTFNDVARNVIKWHGKGEIEYINFPENLKGQYQSFTRANITLLRETGCKHECKTLETGMNDYLNWLNTAQT